MKTLQDKQKINKPVWDLFNPIPEFNYDNMNNNIDVELLDNPYIQVVWEDTADNFTQERIKSVKQYFQKKYNSTNVNVVTKVKTEENIQQTIDVSVNIMDRNYQIELIRSLLTQKGYEDYYDKIINIDSAVENRMMNEDSEITPFKKWYIRKIEFSNFLSYGENQVLDFEKCDGITVVESDPPNFGGKSVLTVDLLLFLFFNTTTKTQKAEEVFNRFSDKNVVSVRGDIIIDGEEYIIARKIERKKSKSGDWNVKSELEFFKKLSDGQLLNFTGEQRRETENFIKRSIGNIDDFLMTILTTASNLEDLLEAKPTARGQVLSRFLGLEFLKKKEEIGKEIYSTYSKGMLSNVYNTEKLKQEIEDSEVKIEELNNEIVSTNSKIKDVDLRLGKGQEYKDNLLKSKYTDIDQELLIMNPIKLQSEISDFENKSESIKEQIKQTIVLEPKEFYHEDKHDEIKDSIKQTNIDIALTQKKIEEIEELVKKYGDGIQCEHCGIKLMEAELTKKKISELGEWEDKLVKLSKQFKSLEKQDNGYTQLKKDFDLYERNKLIKEKYELSLESNDLKIVKLKDNLRRYQEVQDKIKKNNELDSQLVKAGLRIDELITEKRNLERNLVTFQNEIKNLNNTINKNNGLIDKIAEEFEVDKIYKIYLELFGKNGISKIIMKTMMPVINSELQRLLEDSCYFNLEIRINDKNEVEFIMIDNSTGIEKLMTSGSGYEKTIASMALRAVLSKVCSLPKPNVVIWDEVFGKISNDNLELVGEFFNKMKDYFEKIFVITHNPMVNNWANNVIKIKKVDNISKVIQ
jgi:DNA repair exonuclease SbcCD ATPase subunit